MSKTKRALLIAAGVLSLALVTFVVSARRFIFPEKLNVVSIASAAEYQDPARMKRAMALPVAARYEAGAIAFQTNGSLCGPTSIANVLRSLDQAGVLAPQIIEGTGKCRMGVCFGGITLDELADMAREKTKRKVTVLRDLTAEEFRGHVTKSNSPDRRYVINFDRGPLFGKRTGHHSPIGGYLEGEDLVLVIDVNEKYKPWLVRTDRLYEAMNTVDPSAEKKRGLLLIE